MGGKGCGWWEVGSWEGQSCQQTFPEVQWEELSGRSLRPWQCRVVSVEVPSRREGEGRWQEPSRGSQAIRGDPHIIASALQGMDISFHQSWA